MIRGPRWKNAVMALCHVNDGNCSDVVGRELEYAWTGRGGRQIPADGSCAMY